VQNDCQIFNRETMKLDEYFLNNKIISKDEGVNEQVIEINNPNSVGKTDHLKHKLSEKSKSVAKQNNTANNYSKIILRENMYELKSYEGIPDIEVRNSVVESSADEETEKKHFHYRSKSQHSKAKNKSILHIVETKGKGESMNENMQESIGNKSASTVCIKEPTSKDYEELTINERMLYDKRSFSHFLKESIMEEHRIINILFKKTLFIPLFIKTNELVFEISMGLAVNALLFTADYIDKRATANDKVKYL
jgi:hypothetical protein